MASEVNGGGAKAPPPCVLGYDLGKRFGAAVAVFPDGALEAEIGYLGKEDDPPAQMRVFRKRHEALFERWQPMAIGYEDPGFAVQAAGQLWIRRLEGFLISWCDERDILLVPIHSSTVKAHAFRNGALDPRKELAKGEKLAKGVLKRAVCEGAVRRQWIAKATKKNEDAADAAWVADALRKHPLLRVERKYDGPDLDF